MIEQAWQAVMIAAVVNELLSGVREFLSAAVAARIGFAHVLASTHAPLPSAHLSQLGFASDH